MLGIEYARISQNLSVAELSKRAKISVASINSIQKGDVMHIRTQIMRKIADALGISIDELYAECSAEQVASLPNGVFRKSNSENPKNCLSNYRVQKKLPLQEFADRLGLTAKESARVVCKVDQPMMHHIRTLAAFEGISVEQFMLQYRSPDEGGIAE